MFNRGFLGSISKFWPKIPNRNLKIIDLIKDSIFLDRKFKYGKLFSKLWVRLIYNDITGRPGAKIDSQKLAAIFYRLGIFGERLVAVETCSQLCNPDDNIEADIRQLDLKFWKLFSPFLKFWIFVKSEILDAIWKI